MKRVLYTIWQILWGLPQTLVGAMVFLVFRPHRHDWFHGVLVSSWPYRSCVSLGMFVFIADSAIGHTDSLANPERPSLQHIIAHEYGHTVQSALLGPLYLPIMGLPSALWANLRAASRWRSAQERSYYDFPTERFANYLGNRVLGMDTPK